MAARHLPADGPVLEVGSGKAAFAHFAGRDHYVGLEFNDAAIARARDGGVTLLEADRRGSRASESGHYAAVVSFQVLEHVRGPAAFIAGCVDALARGGTLILAVPDHEGLCGIAQNNILDMPPHHVSHWSSRTLAHMGQQFALDTIAIEREPVAPIHVPWAQRSIVEQRLRHWSGSSLVHPRRHTGQSHRRPGRLDYRTSVPARRRQRIGAHHRRLLPQGFEAPSTVKPLLVSHSDSAGGAARATYRLQRALVAAAVPSRMRVASKASGDWHVVGPAGQASKAWALLRTRLGQQLLKGQRTSNPLPHSPAVIPSRLASGLDWQRRRRDQPALDRRRDALDHGYRPYPQARGLDAARLVGFLWHRAPPRRARRPTLCRGLHTAQSPSRPRRSRPRRMGVAAQATRLAPPVHRGDTEPVAGRLCTALGPDARLADSRHPECLADRRVPPVAPGRRTQCIRPAARRPDRVVRRRRWRLEPKGWSSAARRYRWWPRRCLARWAWSSVRRNRAIHRGSACRCDSLAR